MTPADIISYIPLLVGGIVAVVAISVFGWVHNTRLRIKHGYPLENMWGQPLRPELTSEAMERVRMLTRENAGLRAELGSIKDRLAVIERIVTDKGFDVARQIEQLRDERAAPQQRDGGRDMATN